LSYGTRNYSRNVDDKGKNQNCLREQDIKKIFRSLKVNGFVRDIELVFLLKKYILKQLIFLSLFFF